MKLLEIEKNLEVNKGFKAVKVYKIINSGNEIGLVSVFLGLNKNYLINSIHIYDESKKNYYTFKVIKFLLEMFTDLCEIGIYVELKDSFVFEKLGFINTKKFIIKDSEYLYLFHRFKPDLYLLFPEKKFEKHWYELVKQFELTDETGIFFDSENYDSYLKFVIERHNKLNVSTYFLIQENKNKIIGVLNIYYSVVYEDKFVGNFEYIINPTERGKGYGNKLFFLALIICREVGLERILIQSKKDDLEFIKIIKNNQGILLEERKNNNGDTIQIYCLQ